MQRFKVDLNLDDRTECEYFIETYTTMKGRALANKLGLVGKGSTLLATALSNYAWNKYTAINVRSRGFIGAALQYEKIADRIYQEDIQPVCECW